MSCGRGTETPGFTDPRRPVYVPRPGTPGRGRGARARPWQRPGGACAGASSRGPGSQRKRRLGERIWAAPAGRARAGGGRGVNGGVGKRTWAAPAGRARAGGRSRRKRRRGKADLGCAGSSGRIGTDAVRGRRSSGALRGGAYVGQIDPTRWLLGQLVKRACPALRAYPAWACDWGVPGPSGAPHAGAAGSGLPANRRVAIQRRYRDTSRRATKWDRSLGAQSRSRGAGLAT